MIWHLSLRRFQLEEALQLIYGVSPDPAKIPVVAELSPVETHESSAQQLETTIFSLTVAPSRLCIPAALSASRWRWNDVLESDSFTLDRPRLDLVSALD